jgi:hypothetical protein
MPSQSLSQSRVISPVNTSIAQGIQQNEYVGGFLFPQVPVDMRAGKIITFGREHFMQYEGMRRSPGANTPRVKFGYASGDYLLEDFSIEGTLPIENQQEQLATSKGYTIRGAEIALTGARQIIDMRLEIAQAALATTVANYPSTNRVTLSAGSQFNDSAVDPVPVFTTAKAVVRANTGKPVNTMVIGDAALQPLLENPKILARLNYTGVNVAGLDDLRRILRIPNIYVGNAIKADDAGAISDVWGKDVVLAYTETGSMLEMGRPTFGYTYNLGGYPQAEDAYYENNNKTWFFPVSACEVPVIASSVAGYLIKNAVA